MNLCEWYPHLCVSVRIGLVVMLQFCIMKWID